MKRYEYIRILIDMGDLEDLNRFSRDGWRVAAIVAEGRENYALLERPLPE